MPVSMPYLLVLFVLMIFGVEVVRALKIHHTSIKQCKQSVAPAPKQLHFDFKSAETNEYHRPEVHPSLVLPTVAVIATLSQPAMAFAADSADLAIISTVRPLLDTFISVMSFLFLCRTILSWYPKTDVKKFPYNVVSWPTEPLLQPVRDLVPPAFGVDISAIVWVMLLSFVREILTGQQGILTLIERS